MPDKVRNTEKSVQILERVMGEKITGLQSNKWLQNIQKKKIIKGDFLIKAGEKPQGIALIESGILRIYCIDHDGNEITKVFAGENKIFLCTTILYLVTSPIIMLKPSKIPNCTSSTIKIFKKK